MNEGKILQEAIALATHLHDGHHDKLDRPCLDHLERVADMVHRSGGTPLQEAAAWLHESLEDTSTTSAVLALIVPSIVVGIVVAMTHYEDEPHPAYWARVKAVPDAVLVKLCDIHDNLDPARMCLLDEATQKRMRSKHARAIAALVE